VRPRLKAGEVYRAARDKLLKEEITLRRQIEAVAVMRRKLPLGGSLKEDYVFDDGGAVRFSDLFADGKNTLLVYSFMFGPQMKAACTSCTSTGASTTHGAASCSSFPSIAGRTDGTSI
jgi:predicted dithiol-disulfide oxidoreductase (DUF899 family)